MLALNMPPPVGLKPFLKPNMSMLRRTQEDLLIKICERISSLTVSVFTPVLLMALQY